MKRQYQINNVGGENGGINQYQKMANGKDGVISM